MINPDLPIKEAKRGLLYALDNHHVVILTAETGSGKTTQIPKYLIEAGYTIGSKKIAIVLPRRIAAVSIARRLS
jgi:HrpA-like RNA helicase